MYQLNKQGNCTPDSRVRGNDGKKPYLDKILLS